MSPTEAEALSGRPPAIGITDPLPKRAPAGRTGPTEVGEVSGTPVACSGPEGHWQFSLAAAPKCKPKNMLLAATMLGARYWD